MATAGDTPATTAGVSAATPIRRIRMSDDLWEKLDQAVRAADPEADRSTVLRQFARWYVGERGAKLPERPKEKTT